MEYQYFPNILIGILNKQTPVNKNILQQIKGDLWRKTASRQLWNVLDLEISFWAIGQKFLENNTKKNGTFA